MKHFLIKAKVKTIVEDELVYKVWAESEEHAIEVLEKLDSQDKLLAVTGRDMILSTGKAIVKPHATLLTELDLSKATTKLKRKKLKCYQPT